MKHGADEGELLFHPLGIIDGEFVDGIGEFEPLEQTVGAPGDLGFREAMHFADEADDLAAAKVIVEDRLVRADSRRGA